MKRFPSSVALFMVSILLTSAQCLAQAPRNMNEAITSASTIVVGRLDQYIPEPESLDRNVQERMRSSGGIAGGTAEMAVMSTINPRGTYGFTILSTIKGNPPQRLFVRLPRVTSRNGLRGGGAPQSIPLKARYLLILAGNEATGFSPLGRAPLEIGENVELPKGPIDLAKSDALVGVVSQLLIDSLSDPRTSATAAEMLQATMSEQVVKTMRAYIDDPDESVRAAALSCLALNQDVTVIPKIAELGNAAGSATTVLTTFRRYETPEAIPYFNQLLIDPSVQPIVHTAAAQGLRRLPPDVISIPFWFKALKDPNPQSTIVYDAYNALHVLIPELGPPKNVRDFGAVRDQEIKILETWWADEQAGKHAPATR